MMKMESQIKNVLFVGTKLWYLLGEQRSRRDVKPRTAYVFMQEAYNTASAEGGFGMERNPITTLDGPIEEQIATLKEWLGLRPDQSFQDLDVEIYEEDEE